MKHILYLILFLTFLPLHTYAHWERSVTSYTRRSYQAAAQNWDIMQQENGWMYFANDKGLLEFDGSNWTVYPMNGVKVKAIAKGNDGRIYAGGLKEFGYYEADELGRLKYISLSDSLKGSDTGNIWDIAVDGTTVYYRADNVIFRFTEGGRISRIPAPSTGGMLLEDGKLYTYLMGPGMKVLEGEELKGLPNRNSPGNVGKAAGFFTYKDYMLLVTSWFGIYIYRDDTWERVSLQPNSYTGKTRFSCAALQGDLLALGTMQEGVLLINLENLSVERISDHNGLQGKAVQSAAFDREGNLWLGMDSGIDCVHLNSPVYKRSGRIGVGYASAVFGNHLYLGTNQGLFETEMPNTNLDVEIRNVNRRAGQVFSLDVYDGRLFCASNDRLAIVEPDGQITYIVLYGVWKVIDTPQPDVLLAGTFEGFWNLRKGKDGQWRKGKRLAGRRFSSKSLCREPGTRTLWTANKEDGLWRAEVSENYDSLSAVKCYNNEILPAGDNVCLAIVDGEVKVASPKGLFRYDAGQDAMVRDTLLEKAADGTATYTYIHQDSARNVWYVANGALKVLRYDKLIDRYVKKEREAYLAGALIENFEHVNVINTATGEAVVGLEDGFALLRPELLEEQTPAPPQIRQVWARGVKDSLLWGSSYLKADMPELHIPYRQNSLRFCYGAPNYDKQLAQTYSCWLEGPVSGKWTQPDGDTEREYMALPPGKYTFHVRTSVGQGESATASLQFRILPPWYLNRWFIGGCTIVFCALMGTAAWKTREDSRILKKENEKKEEKINTLEEEKLQTELQHKSEELMRTTLNIVRKNEMLQNIRKEVQDISHTINEEDPVALRRKTLRLLGQIDTNMEHDNDLEAFQHSFDSVHHGFFKQLEAAYPKLTTKEKMLCAYIRMDLLSKEIAPLLNISIRGVEISRYRLRKKLELKEGESLTEFLHRFSD